MILMLLNDEILTAETMKEELDWKSYGIDKVYLAFSVEEAKKVLNENKIDITLCDIEMPGENGIDLLRWMRQKDLDVDCIFLTCHASFFYAQEAVKLGCLDYILIPAKYEEIGASIQKVVLRRKQGQEESILNTYGRQWLKTQSEVIVEQQGEKKSPAEIVKDTVDFIRMHLGDEELSVNNMATHFYMNPIYLNRIFKKEMGTSISQFIIKERMELAANLLKNSKLSAQLIAIRVGYPNYSHFSATYKKYFGYPPTHPPEA